MDLGRPLAAVTSALDGDSLTVLATHDAAFTTGRSIGFLVIFRKRACGKRSRDW